MLKTRKNNALVSLQMERYLRSKHTKRGLDTRAAEDSIKALKWEIGLHMREIHRLEKQRVNLFDKIDKIGSSIYGDLGTVGDIYKAIENGTLLKEASGVRLADAKQLLSVFEISYYCDQRENGYSIKIIGGTKGLPKVVLTMLKKLADKCTLYKKQSLRYQSSVPYRLEFYTHPKTKGKTANA